MTQYSKKESQLIVESQSRMAIGVFITVFGLVVLAATFFTDSLPGQYANIFSGLVLLIVGLAFGLSGWRQFRTLKR